MVLISDTILPRGSTVILTGLADGGVLWELLEGRMHPLGEYRSDIDYPALYGYLECLEVSPCMGWMSANATLRTVTTEHAMKLSKAAQDIAETETFEHFDMIYYDFDIRPSIELWFRFQITAAFLKIFRFLDLIFGNRLFTFKIKFGGLSLTSDNRKSKAARDGN